MKNDILEPVVTIGVAILGVAILAVLVSQRSNTAGVLTAAGSSFANALSAAEAPVTGAQATINTGGGGGIGSPFNLGGANLSIP